MTTGRLDDFIKSLYEFDKATLSYFCYANQLANYMTEGLVAPIDWITVFERDKRRFPGKEELDGLFFANIFVYADNLGKQYASLEDSHPEKEKQQIEALLQDEKSREKLLIRLTGNDARAMEIEALQQYQRVTHMASALQSQIDGLIYQADPSTPISLEADEIRKIILLLNLSQFGNTERSLRKRLELIRKAKLEGLGVTILNDSIGRLQTQCKSIKIRPLTHFTHFEMQSLFPNHRRNEAASVH